MHEVSKHEDSQYERTYVTSEEVGGYQVSVVLHLL